jgi:hypothetical protein
MLSPVVAMPHNPLAYSTFLDAFGANLSTTQQYDLLAAGIHQPLLELLQYGSVVPTIRPASGSITVGLVLDRANDPTALLSGNWAERQAALAAFAEPNTPWPTYGADPTLYANTASQVGAPVPGQRRAQRSREPGLPVLGRTHIEAPAMPGRGNVRFDPKIGQWRRAKACPLRAISGRGLSISDRSAGQREWRRKAR